MGDRDAEHQRPATRRVARQARHSFTPAGTDVIAGHQLVDARARPAAPRARRKNRWRRRRRSTRTGASSCRSSACHSRNSTAGAAIGRVEVTGVMGLPSLRSGVAVRPSSTRGRTVRDEGIEAIGRQAVALVHHHGVPVLSPPAGPPARGWSRCRWWRRGGRTFGRCRRPAARRTPDRAAPRGRCAAPDAGSPPDAPRKSRRGRRPFGRRCAGSRTPPPRSCRCRWPPPPGCGGGHVHARSCSCSSMSCW
jgi:hypothetical protein